MILCQEIIWLQDDKVNTYCMREKGHPGKHYILDREPTEYELDALKQKESSDASSLQVSNSIDG